MSGYKNSFGIIVSDLIYKELNGSMHLRFFQPGKGGINSEERLWFMLSNELSPVICKKVDYFPYYKFTESGLLVDNSDIKIYHDVYEMNEIIKEILYGKSTYIHYCNLIRNKFAESFRYSFRWNGAEKESLFNYRIYSRCSYISGLAENTFTIDINGNEIGEIPSLGEDSGLINAYNIATGLGSPGQ